MTDWRHEDGGPRRRQLVPGGLHATALEVTSRLAPAATMLVRDDARLFLLRHGAGDGATSFVEQLDPATLEPVQTSPELAGGPVWPGGVALHDNGDLHVVFGNHAHRLDAELRVLTSCALPRVKPYNSFVTLPDGHLVTKDFGGSRPGTKVAAHEREPCELVVLDPDALEIVDRAVMPEPSIARLSASGNTVYVVGDTSLLRATWDGARLDVDRDFVAPYRTMEGQTFGWDCVLTDTAAWFLDDGDGSEQFSGTLRGHGLSTAPLHLVHVDLATADVAMVEICGAPGGLVANPPVVDEARGLVVGYDSGNGVVAAFAIDSLERAWEREQDHGSHCLLYDATGELVMGDGADVVVLDITTGEERARCDTQTGIQSVLFPCPGFGRDFYVCSFMGPSRLAVTG